MGSVRVGGGHRRKKVVPPATAANRRDTSLPLPAHSRNCGQPVPSNVRAVARGACPDAEGGVEGGVPRQLAACGAVHDGRHWPALPTGRGATAAEATPRARRAATDWRVGVPGGDSGGASASAVGGRHPVARRPARAIASHLPPPVAAAAADGARARPTGWGGRRLARRWRRPEVGAAAAAELCAYSTRLFGSAMGGTRMRSADVGVRQRGHWVAAAAPVYIHYCTVRTVYVHPCNGGETNGGLRIPSPLNWSAMDQRQCASLFPTPSGASTQGPAAATAGEPPRPWRAMVRKLVPHRRHEGRGALRAVRRHPDLHLAALLIPCQKRQGRSWGVLFLSDAMLCPAPARKCCVRSAASLGLLLCSTS